MKLAVLTSSRADFGIYLPLLKSLTADSSFEVEIIAFGTHLSRYHGYTLNEIVENGFTNIKTVSCLLTNDDAAAISTAYGLTCLKFADFWAHNPYDMVFCLGDRFEMSAAVQAGIPFNVKFAHLHGGETTLGAIDNVYRHQITLASILHFTAAEYFAHRIEEIKGTQEGIYCVGSLSLSNIDKEAIPSESEFRERFDLRQDFILITFHPETVSVDMNSLFVNEMLIALRNIAQKVNLVITMPNADTMGSIYRQALIQLQAESPANVKLIENFGKTNYFAAMSYCRLLLGNTSSGIIEAASFNKFVINVGNRQRGRAQSRNTFNCSFSAKEIEQLVNEVLAKGAYDGQNIYYREGTVETIIQVLKSHIA